MTQQQKEDLRRLISIVQASDSDEPAEQLAEAHKELGDERYAALESLSLMDILTSVTLKDIFGIASE